MYWVIKYRNIDYFFLKISLYRNIFFKIPIPNIFTASQVFACISRQPDLNSFKIQQSIKYIFYKIVIITLHMISNMHFKDIKGVASMNTLNLKKKVPFSQILPSGLSILRGPFT